MKNRIVYILLVICILVSPKGYAQQSPANVDAGLIEKSTPKSGEIDQTEETLGETVENDVDTQALNDTDNNNQTQKDLKVLIKGFDINESAILTKEEIDNITSKLQGKKVGIEELKIITDGINELYIKKGFITARAYLPPQTVKDGIVQIKLIEGHVGKIYLEGNKWTKSAYIEDKISQKPGNLFELKALEKDILKFNRTNQVKLRASLKPGEQVGETDVYLTANDPFPFHIVPTFDNTGRSTVGVLRGGLSASADSLFGYRDQFVMGYSRAKSTDVAYSSYSLPVGNKGTRVGGSFAFSNIKISSGPFKPFNIEGNSYNYGGFISQPFISTRRFDFSGDIGVNFRQVTTFFDEVPLFTTQIRSLAVGLNFEYRDTFGRWISRHEFTNGLDLLGGNARFFKYNGNLTRLHNFGHGVIGIFRAATQLTDDRLPPVEQFQVGGSGTVRGYSEGLLIGDNGYLFSGELRFPLPLPKKVGKLDLRDRIRGVVFVDHGAAFVDDGNISSPHHTNFLTSVGVGLRGSITKYISGRVDWGFALGRREDPQPTARMHFGLQANPM